MSRYSKITVGDSASLTHKVTQKDIEQFVALSGDDNRLHLDDEFAKSTHLKQRVAHGMIGASFISTIIGTKLPGDGALWYQQSLEFILPVRIGDILTVKAEVIKKYDKIHSLEIKTEIYNHKKQVVTKGVGKVKVVEPRPEKLLNNEKSKVTPVVLIIGATGGIGSQVAHCLAKDNYDLILHYYKNEKKALSLKEQLQKSSNGKFITAQADMRDENSIKDLFNLTSRYYDSILGVVNSSVLEVSNLGFNDLDWNDIKSQIEMHVKSSFLLVKQFIPLMEKASYGKFVFISSQLTEKQERNWLHYITAKSAQNGMVKALAMDLAHLGIRVNQVSPGMTDTPLITDFSEKSKLLTAANTPLKRLAHPKDVANAIAYLISSKSDFLTGETIRVNGGQVMV